MGPKIIDVIKTSTQLFLVLDRKPVFEYEYHLGRQYLVARDGDFSSVYGYEYVRPDAPSHWKAFSGAKFSIPLKGGGEVEAWGQWWHSSLKEEHDSTYQLGANTIEGLHQCYVFTSTYVRKEVVDEWLAKNQPKTDYEYYRRSIK